MLFRSLAETPPEPAPPDSLEPLPEALIFFLNAEQHALVSEALRAVGEKNNAECPGAPGQNAERTANGSVRGRVSRPPRRAETFEARPAVRGDAKRLGRAERLERLALWYLESVGRR